VNDLLEAIMRHRNAQLAFSDQTIEPLAAHNARIQRLRTVPSIGPVTATAFVATLDDVQRFRRAHQVEASLGLLPRERSAGESQRRGHIAKAVPAHMRWLLIHVAVSIHRCRPPQAEALHIAARRGKHIAVAALARRVAGILSALLRDGTTFDSQRSPRPVVAATLAASATG
jgi:transposase